SEAGRKFGRGLIGPLNRPRPRISLPRIVYSKSCTSSRSALQCSGWVWASPKRFGVRRFPSGFCHTRPSVSPSGWHDEQLIHFTLPIGGFAEKNSSLPRRHSGVCGGVQTFTDPSLLRAVRSYTATSKSRVW